MKKTKPTESQASNSDDLSSHYEFDYVNARPNRFAGLPRERQVVLLEPDVSKVFTTSESVNAILRALIASMPSKPRRVKAGQ